MKSLLSIALLGFFILSAGCSMAQTAKDTETLKVKVFFHCPNGKKLLETKLSGAEGVQSVVADLETKVVTIIYDPQLLNQEKLVDMIEQIGYYTEFSDKDKKINKACSHGDGDGHDHDHDH